MSCTLAKIEKIALVGNPNSGKTTLFNRLTGLNQRVGNYPGITVDKRSGAVKTSSDEYTVIDLPGTYSMSSTSNDERVVQNILLNPENPDFPDAIIFVVDATNLLRNLFLASQVIDLGIPTIMAMNMVDVLEKEGKSIDFKQLEEYFGVPIISISARKGVGIDELKKLIPNGFKKADKPLIDPYQHGGEALKDFEKVYQGRSSYMTFKTMNNSKSLDWFEHGDELQQILSDNDFNIIESEILDINDRYKKINELIDASLIDTRVSRQKKRTERIDKYVTHPVWGLVIFLATFFIVFQSIFTFAQWPMDAINDGMTAFGGWVAKSLPAGVFNAFLVDGIIAGLAGVLVFVPQIMILFGLITLLEDSGYLARVSFMMDGMLKRFGMNGKSVVPLVGGFACAIPAIMSARSIQSRKERLITIFITPLMSCSARLPVYVFLVSFVAPDDFLFGVSVQGLFMMGLYLLGIVFSLLIAILINKFMKGTDNSSFILELPNYKPPDLRTALTSMINKGKAFVMQAGKIILIASMILWVLSYFGPAAEMERIEEKYQTEAMQEKYDQSDLDRMVSSEKLEQSYLGRIGKIIEPAIEPLGYDWKTGIAVVASFAAREVFVGTMATIYSVENDMDAPKGLKAITFSYPAAFSLLIFYVFALQCMSTIAIVKQEVGNWKIPILQFLIFTGMAYVFSLFTYQVLT